MSILIDNTKGFFGSALRDKFVEFHRHIAYQKGISRYQAETCLNKILLFSASLQKVKEFQLAKPTLQIAIITDFLNKNPIFKEQVLPGASFEINEMDLISYYNLRAMPAIVNEWLPAKALYHKLSPHKDESVTVSEVNQILVFRQKCDCILSRGDTRPPEEVLQAAGFTPTVPSSAFADRRNESVLRELAHHFPARISFTSENSIAQRYMRNAAYRQKKQFSYIYYVNVKNMETVDIRLNLEEGHLGRFLQREKVDQFTANWVDEHVVLGTFIPVENITKVEKYEVVTADPKSPSETIRKGFKICGVYHFNHENRSFDYEEIDSREQLFKYKSVNLISFIGRRRHQNPDKEPELYSIDTIDWPTFRSSWDIPSKLTRGLRLMTPRNSLAGNYISMVSINYDLEDDEKNKFRITLAKFREAFKKLQSPAKIYIYGYKSDDCEAIIQLTQQSYHRSPQKFRLKLKTLAELLKKTMPIHRSINFHFLMNDGFMLAAPFLTALIEAGFQNCFVVSYIGDVEVLAEEETNPYSAITLKDFGSSANYDSFRDKILHHSDRPSLPDNKIITFYANGKVSQAGYREWLKAHPQQYSREYRKNLWVQNYTAILTETVEFLNLQAESQENFAQLRAILSYLMAVTNSYQQELLTAEFSAKSCATFLMSIFKTLDIIAAHPKVAIAQPLINEIFDKLPKDDSEVEAVNYDKDFVICYHTFKRSFLPIIPIEFSEAGYSLETSSAQKTTTNVFKVPPDPLPPEILAAKLALGEIPDFTDNI
ncbi:hypothetical protein AAEX28_10980 [Lentisphaerota bacterium WC36G]